MANMVELRRVWGRDAELLRKWSGILGGLFILAGVFGIVISVVLLFGGAPVTTGLMILLNGVVGLAVGGFVLYLGRGVACLIEIAWYGLIDNRERG